MESSLFVKEAFGRLRFEKFLVQPKMEVQYSSNIKDYEEQPRA
jgi:hypothetical protein